MPPDWGDISHITFQIHCVGGAYGAGKKSSQFGTNSFSLYEKATVSFFLSPCLASLDSCVTHSRVTHRFLKDRTTEKRDKKETVDCLFCSLRFIDQSDFVNERKGFIVKDSPD